LQWCISEVTRKIEQASWAPLPVTGEVDWLAALRIAKALCGTTLLASHLSAPRPNVTLLWGVISRASVSLIIRTDGAVAFPSEHDLEPTHIQAESHPADDGRDGCNVQVSLWHFLWPVGSSCLCRGFACAANPLRRRRRRFRSPILLRQSGQRLMNARYRFRPCMSPITPDTTRATTTTMASASSDHVLKTSNMGWVSIRPAASFMLAHRKDGPLRQIASRRRAIRPAHGTMGCGNRRAYRRRSLWIRGSGMNRIGRRTAYAMVAVLIFAIVWQVLGSL